MAHGMRWHVRWPWRSQWRMMVVLAAALLPALAGCAMESSGPGETRLAMVLAGSTADQPGKPPTITATSPDGTYAFVYANQIWLHRAGQAGAIQVTDLLLPRGASIGWGPLVWSASGRYIAFSLVQNVTPSAPGRAAGALYYVDTARGPSFGETRIAGGTASIYGHAYAWLGDSALFFANGGGVMMSDIDDADPRIWPVVPGSAPDSAATASSAASASYGYGDIGIADGYLYYTALEIWRPSTTGAVGKALVKRLAVGSPDDYRGITPSSHFGVITDRFASNGVDAGQQVADLGLVYSDPSGNYVTGTWQVRGDVLVSQRIDRVDAGGDRVTSQFCMRHPPTNTACHSVLNGIGAQPRLPRPSMLLSDHGDRVAFAASALYIQEIGDGGSAPSQVTLARGSTLSSWLPAGDADDVVAVTSINGQQTEASGAISYQTNIVVYAGGRAPLALVRGGEDLSWQP